MLSHSIMTRSESENVRYEEDFILNSRGMKLSTCRWTPMGGESKGLIFLCHGYAMECSIMMDSTARKLVKTGFEVYGMDYESHGKSDGLQAYVDNFHNPVDDVSTHFSAICEQGNNIEKARFLLGESMGGAVALMLDRNMPDYWDGLILVAPMCKIAEEMTPNSMMIAILTKLVGLFPTWNIVPGNDVIDYAFKEPEVRNQLRANPFCYKGRVRLKTAYELYCINRYLEQSLHEMTVPFLVLHGEEDKVTDTEVSKLLYQAAPSQDNTLKIYPGMWHALLSREPPEKIEIVFADIISWLEQRNEESINPRSERERKKIEDQTTDKQ